MSAGAKCAGATHAGAAHRDPRCPRQPTAAHTPTHLPDADKLEPVALCARHKPDALALVDDKQHGHGIDRKVDELLQVEGLPRFFPDAGEF